jgi:hypothetical protein
VLGRKVRTDPVGSTADTMSCRIAQGVELRALAAGSDGNLSGPYPSSLLRAGSPVLWMGPRLVRKVNFAKAGFDVSMRVRPIKQAVAVGYQPTAQALEA